MIFLINEEELAAICGLPHVQQLAYLRGIRPYMDIATGLVGIKRGISHQSIAEQLYVEPHPGIKSSICSRAQIRRALVALERVGLITQQSQGLKLILKCELASNHFSVQNKVVANPSQQGVLFEDRQTLEDIGVLQQKTLKADLGDISKADTPLKENNYIYLLSQFEKFWSLYPLAQNKQKAWEVFLELNPDSGLMNCILEALEAQIDHYQENLQKGNWLPNWKYPANWLRQESWKDELITYKNMEARNAQYQRRNPRKSAITTLFESCRAGKDFEFSGEEPGEGGEVIQFCKEGQY